ncbi:uncharacterized protein ISCGN_013113 [Ixodes scapularis]
MESRPSVYRLCKAKMTFFKDLGIPGPKSHPIYGNLPELFEIGVLKATEGWASKYGDIVGYFDGFRPVMIVRDTQLLKQIFIRNFDSFNARLSCDVQAYEVVFGTLKTSLETKFGGVGGLSTSTTWHFDYESAAIQAVMNVFKTTAGFPKVRGCAFHFAKAINTKRDELGLRALCREDPEVNKWFVRIRHLPFVPDHCRLLFSSDLLAAKPNLPQLNAARLDQFIRYFRNFWLSHSIIREIWGQFGNRGPRTTNVVEGWHNGLHSRLSSRHPDLTEFIQFLQVAQHAAQNRIQALLLDPLAVARPTSSSVSARNERLHAEIDAFASFTSGNAATYQDVCNYVDRIASTGVLPAAT